MSNHGPGRHSVVADETHAARSAGAALVDVTALAADAGFELPVAMTIEAWQEAVAWDDRNLWPENEASRLWHVLVMARRCASPSRSRSPFPVVRSPNIRRASLPRVITLHLVRHAVDGGQTVLTIARPGQTWAP
jgi:hypothetical protein